MTIVLYLLGVVGGLILYAYLRARGIIDPKGYKQDWGLLYWVGVVFWPVVVPLGACVYGIYWVGKAIYDRAYKFFIYKIQCKQKEDNWNTGRRA